MQRRRRSREEAMDINITPMLDIVFIMLIFFIVTTSFVKETGIDPKRPVAETAAAKPAGNILIGIDTEGQIWMNNRRIEITQVRQLVEDAVVENPESSAVLISDEVAPTGILIDIMDQVRLAGVTNISVSAIPEST
ncbi:MAG: biopolymer transporter ExbD [Gammaproteobacteria bacterium]|nr:biopolymer transporter ExbD [Gammaproteobacteria bacterium]MDH3481143.1 biopolymer transporter ExbD [Gammaproteobacteria bacterium]